MMSERTASGLASPPAFVRIEPVGLVQPGRGSGHPATPAFMHVDVFHDIVERLPPGTELHLGGPGDPLLHLHLFDMVRHAAGRGMRVLVRTELSVLTEARAAECAQSSLAALHVAMDGASRDTYAALRGRDRFERVLRNLRRLVQARRKAASSMRVRLVAVAARANLRELPDLVRLAHDEGVGELMVQPPCHDFCGPPGTAAHAHGLRLEDPQQVRHWFERSRALAASLGVALVLPAVRRRVFQVRPNGRRRCDAPWRRDAFGFDGEPVPSCMSRHGVAPDASAAPRLSTTIREQCAD